MNAETFLQQSSAMASAPIMTITDNDWQRSTPCIEWDLRALVRHMVYELVWIPDLLAGKTIAEVGDEYEGDILGSNPLVAWSTAMQNACEAAAATEPDKMVHLSVGDAPASEYLNEVAADLLIHGWDVAKSLNYAYEIDDDLLDSIEALLPALNTKYGQYNVFGAPLTVDESASRQTKLLALLGRAT